MIKQRIKKLVLIPVIIGLFIISSPICNAASRKEVIPGGIPFGIKLYTDGLLVVGFSDVECSSGSKKPAADAGIRVGDVLTELNGERIVSSEDFVSKIENSKDGFTLTYKRGDKVHKTTVKPSLSDSDGKYKSGMWLRDTAAGIGTVTYIDPQSGEFAGLGHGICDSESGKLISIKRGIVAGVNLTGIKIGAAGDPGELRGYFTESDLGVILKNTAGGVFGIYDNIPQERTGVDSYPLAERDEVKEGAATVLSTVDGDGVCEYEIMITRIPESEGTANFELCVTDAALIAKTGGIVQGM